MPVDDFRHRESTAEQTDSLSRRKWLFDAIAFVGGAAAVKTLLAKNADADEHHLTKELEALIDREWHGEKDINDIYFELIALHGMQKFYESRAHPEAAFMSAKQIAAGKGICACCSDEGNTEFCNENGIKMMQARSPGAGILDAIDREDKDPFAPEFLEKKVRRLLDAGITVVTSHRLCGAAKMVFGERIQWLCENDEKQEADNIEKEGAEAYGQRWANTVATLMRQIGTAEGIAYVQEIRSAHIKKLNRPDEIHVARIIYVTDDNAFDSSNMEFPKGFVEQTGGEDLSTVLRHVDILRRIGFDNEHGFGTKFSEKPSEQFVICCVANEPHRLEAIMAHARKQVSTLEPKEVRKKIRVEGFVRKQ